MTCCSSIRTTSKAENIEANRSHPETAAIDALRSPKDRMITTALICHFEAFPLVIYDPTPTLPAYPGLAARKFPERWKAQACYDK